MMTRTFPLLLAVPFVLCACGGKSRDAAPSPGVSTPAHAASAAPAAGKVAALAPPTPAEVLGSIYQRDAQGKDTMPIANGSQATYWYGRQFDLLGKHYFTGFAFDTPEKYGPQPDSALPAPDATVTLTAANFERTDEHGGSWEFVGAERYIGEFGGREHPNAIDEKRQPVAFETTDGQYLLAVPTVFFEQGSELRAWDVFVFQPGTLKDVEDTHWTHLGTLQAGEENSAACSDDGSVPMPCIDSIGALSFVAQEGAVMPLVRIQFSGTTIEGPGKKRTLGAADTKTYRYDAAKKIYAAAP